jgi:hypothetical protein
MNEIEKAQARVEALRQQIKTTRERYRELERKAVAPFQEKIARLRIEIEGLRLDATRLPHAGKYMLSPEVAAERQKAAFEGRLAGGTWKAIGKSLAWARSPNGVTGEQAKRLACRYADKILYPHPRPPNYSEHPLYADAFRIVHGRELPPD